MTRKLKKAAYFEGTNSQECSRKLLYLGELNFPLHQSSMYLQVSKWPPDLLICSMPHCVTKFTRNWTMNLTYSWPTNKIPARIPYHFHVEANKRFVRCHTWVQSMHNKMYSYNAKFNQNWNSCCIPEFRFPGRSFHIKLFHLQMCFAKLRMRDDTNLLNSHSTKHSTKLNPQPCGAISSTTCKLILLLVWNQGGNKRSKSFKLRTH